VMETAVGVGQAAARRAGRPSLDVGARLGVRASVEGNNCRWSGAGDVRETKHRSKALVSFARVRGLLAKATCAAAPANGTRWSAR